MDDFSKEHPNEAEALKLRAEHRNLSEDWRGVAEDLEAVRRLQPGASFHAMLANAYKRSGRSQEAEAEYTRELALHPSAPILLEGRAGLRLARGAVTGALEDMREALRGRPDDAPLTAKLADVEEKAGLLEQALAHLKQAAALQPGYWPYLFRRGIIAARCERWQEAERDMDQALRHLEGASAAAREKQTAYCYRGWARFKQGREGAEDDLNEALRLDSRDPQALCFRALARIARGDSGAIEDLDAALTCDPRDPFAYSVRGEYHLRLRKDKAAALADFKKAIELDPDHAAALAESLRLAQP